MLRRLRITNYALIEHLEIEFKSGFTVITGETGAGKSILLGALGLVLGARADSNVLHDKNSKCLVEAVFDITNLPLQAFFSENELDYDSECILTREISVSGKSRAFINDSPVNLLILKALGEQLVDIHSQHDSLHLSESAFQLSILDGLANNDLQLKEYVSTYEKWQQCKFELQQLKNLASDTQTELELIQFQLDELVKVKLQQGEFGELNQKAETLSHAEEIRLSLFTSVELLNRADVNVIQMLRDTKIHLLKAGRYLPDMHQLAERMESSLVEIKDITSDLETAETKIQFEPKELERIQSRISTYRQLMIKHRVSDPDALLQVRNDLQRKLEMIEKKDLSIDQLTKTLKQLDRKLEEKASDLSQSRRKLIPEMERSVRLLLTQLGMPNGRFEAALETANGYAPTGADNLRFLFTANKGNRPEDISKVASGGELSRLMLAIKSLTSGKKMIPTIIFDEIDTGVSGDIAAKVGRIMATMAHQMQLIAITHLPQIAGKAAQHLLVYKRDDDKRTRSLIIQLSEQQRIEEIARMLSDDIITPAARVAAKELMRGF
ncbi:MAG: DNA repair protein RecN (Recombination protein N) [Bacteroidetes bacterium]|nr:MAG: DNA repair protein RecN (Recombination protein N) [Bacteroidota bacterium]